MSRDDGFAVADVDTGLMSDPKVVRLAKRHPTVAGEAMAAYVATVLASWKAGDRVTVEDAVPVWLQTHEAALRDVGLLDDEGKVPVSVWDGWYGPARGRRDAKRDRQREWVASRRAQSTVDNPDVDRRSTVDRPSIDRRSTVGRPTVDGSRARVGTDRSERNGEVPPPPRAATRPPARTRGAWEQDWVKMMCQGQDIRGIRFVDEWDRRGLAYPTSAQGVLLWEWVVDNGWPADEWLIEAPPDLDRDAAITLIKERVHAGRAENAAIADRDEAESAARAAAQYGRRSGTGMTRIA